MYYWKDNHGDIYGPFNIVPHSEARLVVGYHGRYTDPGLCVRRLKCTTGRITTEIFTGRSTSRKTRKDRSHAH
jgi:hypothetical protein